MDPRIKGITAILIITIWIRQTYGIIGYDCISPTTNLTTLSLINVEECDIPLPKVNSSQVFIQLLQLNEFESVKVIQCKVEIDRTIRKCGMFSHNSDVLNGKYAYIHEVTREACIRMHYYGTLEFKGTYIVALKSNQTTSRPAILTGVVDADGKCSGGSYSDLYGTWTNVFVQATVTITLQDYFANVKLSTNRIQLRSGVACDFSTARCTDIEGGNTFWEPIPNDSCKFTSYSTLYRGYAEKVIDNVNEHSQTAYTVNADDTVFALTSTGKDLACGYSLIRTEHPKLVIWETSPETDIAKRTGRVENLDLFTYMNSKFVYVEKHIRNQINQLYRNILLQQCNLELKMLQNALAIATQSPDIFAYHFMKGPGYMALLAGEVIHIIKCVPVEVKLVHTQECYEQLPVMFNNKTSFLTPQTHVLLRQGTQINCNSFAPPMYLLGDSWYKITPRPIETLAPTVIKPMTKTTWKYTSPGALATSGIYTQKDLEDLKDHIMFPAERPAVLNTVARGVMGESTVLSGGSFANLIDEASIEKIALSAWENFWSKFLIFGNISAGLLGIYLFIRAIKLILDTLVHGYALHTVYGWSIYLIGAIWDSLTHLLLHLGQARPKTKNANAPKDDPEQGASASAPLHDLEWQANVQPVGSTNGKSEHAYPSLPLKESTYTFELKG
ncbi:uncharacterized protein [Temnothorax nylanderi]|uniref:uncharacterized protein n=1 Tax=Temnothorax nylanderi TaxID=102681 RepID=UPI003A8B96FC